MRHHLLVIASIGAFAVTLSAPAFAQQEPDVETRLLLANQPCIEKGEDAASTLQSIVDTCQSALTAMGDIYLKASPTKHDENVYRTLFAMAKLKIGASYGKIDGVRSRRTCDAAEQAWQMLPPIDPSRSPADRAAIMRDTVSKTRQVVALCRQDFAKPFAAPDL
jgi:hypothetical protein